MKIKQALTYVGNLAGGAVKLPKWALYAYDGERRVYYYLHDVRTCAYETFDVFTYDVGRNMSGHIRARAVSGVGVLFARFADELPLECIHAPEYPRFSHVAECGPHDRKPQTFDRRGRPEHYGETGERSVTDGAMIGKRRYSRYGWAKYRQNTDGKSNHK